MITERSRRNLESAFHKAVRATLVREPSDVCDIAPDEIGTGSEHPAEKILLITLSAFVFRLVMIFRIPETPAALSYYIREASPQTLAEVVSEVANMCGGALNRELSVGFPNLAMSTPCTVSGKCLAFLAEMKPQYIASYRITINESVKLQAALCLCCSAPVEVADSTGTAEGEHLVGELEMF